MAAIRNANTRPELILRRALHRAGFRFRLHDKRLPGKPDLVLAKYKTAIFVHGCFWHRHARCRFTTTPQVNKSFWLAKFAANLQRDALAKRALRRIGWNVLVVWECQLANDRLPVTLRRVAAKLRSRGLGM